MKAMLPFNVKYIPLTRLALINFEKTPDTAYCGLELQYIEGEPLGKGYRVIAYRNDKFVDVYDEKTLEYISEEKFDVAQKGLRQHVQRDFDNIECDKQNGKVHISFTFMDCDHRKIEVDIMEHTKKTSTSIDLLAPIGVSSMSPSYLPLFFLYDFDFVRRRDTDAKVMIDGKKLKLDPFPFPIPMDMQWRYYTRYSLDSQIVEFLNTDSNKVRNVDLDQESKYTEGAVEYHFEECNGTMALSSIHIKSDKHPLEVVFQPPVSHETHNGLVQILPEKRMGSMEGVYQVMEKEGTIGIKVVPNRGWNPTTNTFISKMIFGEKSVFRSWSKQYTYEQTINKKDLTSDAKWTNGNTTE